MCNQGSIVEMLVLQTSVKTISSVATLSEDASSVWEGTLSQHCNDIIRERSFGVEKNHKIVTGVTMVMIVWLQ